MCFAIIAISTFVMSFLQCTNAKVKRRGTEKRSGGLHLGCRKPLVYWIHDELLTGITIHSSLLWEYKEGLVHACTTPSCHPTSTTRVHPSVRPHLKSSLCTAIAVTCRLWGQGRLLQRAAKGLGCLGFIVVKAGFLLVLYWRQ